MMVRSSRGLWRSSRRSLSLGISYWIKPIRDFQQRVTPASNWQGDVTFFPWTPITAYGPVLSKMQSKFLRRLKNFDCIFDKTGPYAVIGVQGKNVTSPCQFDAGVTRC